MLLPACLASFAYFSLSFSYSWRVGPARRLLLTFAGAAVLALVCPTALLAFALTFSLVVLLQPAINETNPTAKRISANLSLDTENLLGASCWTSSKRIR